MRARIVAGANTLVLKTHQPRPTRGTPLIESVDPADTARAAGGPEERRGEAKRERAQVSVHGAARDMVLGIGRQQQRAEGGGHSSAVSASVSMEALMRFAPRQVKDAGPPWSIARGCGNRKMLRP